MMNRFSLSTPQILVSALATCLLAGCGGGGSENSNYLPTGTTRVVVLTLPNTAPDPLGGSAWQFTFKVTGQFAATITDALSSDSFDAQMHINGYNPTEDTCSSLTLSWRQNRDGDAIVGLETTVNLRNLTNVASSKKNGTIGEWTILTDPYVAPDAALEGTGGTLVVPQ